jgi:AraC family transcriptional regulator
VNTIPASADVLVGEAGLTDGLRLIHRTYQAESRMGRHSHDEWRFCLALSGSYTDSWRGGYRTREARQLSLHPAGEVHTSVFHAPTTCFHIEFSRAWRQRLLGDRGISPEPQEFLVGRAPLLAGQLYDEFLEKDRCSALVVEGLAYELIGWSARESELASRRARWLTEARELVHDRFNATLTLAQIADAVGVHPVHLAREFRREFGSTVGDYIRRLRVDFVSRRLSEAPLSDLALQAGFADQSHLTRVFKRLTGRTPRQLRAIRQRASPSTRKPR